jgi:hypothetical protein
VESRIRQGSVRSSVTKRRRSGTLILAGLLLAGVAGCGGSNGVRITQPPAPSASNASASSTDQRDASAHAGGQGPSAASSNDVAGLRARIVAYNRAFAAAATLADWIGLERWNTAGCRQSAEFKRDWAAGTSPAVVAKIHATMVAEHYAPVPVRIHFEYISQAPGLPGAYEVQEYLPAQDEPGKHGSAPDMFGLWKYEGGTWRLDPNPSVC